MKSLVQFFAGLWVFFSFLPAPAATNKLSPEASISILTFGSSPHELYAAFGHSGIRLCDPVNGYNRVYNYGTFDYLQPLFYLNFAKGYLYYRLSVDPYLPLREFYEENNRFIHEQVLDLTQEQKEKIADFLEKNMQPENQQYLYDYFYNNCATKIRDVFAETLKDDIIFSGDHIKTHYTIRQLTDIYLKQQPWGDLGIDICLGLPMDKTASPYEYMFLPDYLEAGFAHATIRREGQVIPLVKEKRIIFEAAPEKLPFHWYHPYLVFGMTLFAALFVSCRERKKKPVSHLFDKLLFGAAGSFGVLLTLLWTLTDHHAAANNFNLLWALPTHLLPLWFGGFRKPWGRIYFRVTSVICVLLFIAWAFLPQQLNVYLIPVILAIFVRSLALGLRK